MELSLTDFRWIKNGFTQRNLNLTDQQKDFVRNNGLTGNPKLGPIVF